MTVRVADIMAQMEALAPPGLAENWDNCGLQVGDSQWPVGRIMVALDPLPEVVEEACDKQIDLLITHHPLLLRPEKQIDFSTPNGQIISSCATHQLAIYAAHTNLDSALGGLNDIFADLLNLQKRRPMEAVAGPVRAKLVIFTPVSAEAEVREALFASAAGQIGDYSHCAFRLEGQGSFRPGVHSQPAIGRVGKTEMVDEVRIETIIPQDRIESALEAVRRVHPYETMAWDAYPLLSAGETRGLGRVGELPGEVSLKALAKRVKSALQTDHVRVVGDTGLAVTKVALCTGGGGSLVGSFLGSGAQVYITGDVRYHEARTVEQAGRGLIDVGHFASEHIVVNHLVTQLQARLTDQTPAVSIQGATCEKEPFYLV